MKKITVKWLQKHSACISLNEMQKAEKIGDIFSILEELKKRKRYKDANWLLTKYMKKDQCKKYAIFGARLALPIFEKKYPNENSPRKTLEAAEKYLKNKTKKNKNIAIAIAADTNTAIYIITHAAYADIVTYTASAADIAIADIAIAADAADAAICIITNTIVATYAAFAAIKSIEMQLKIINYGIKLLKEDK